MAALAHDLSEKSLSVNSGFISELCLDVKNTSVPAWSRRKTGQRAAQVLRFWILVQSNPVAWMRDEILQVILSTACRKICQLSLLLALVFADLERHFASSRMAMNLAGQKRVMEAIKFLAQEVRPRRREPPMNETML